MMPKYEWICGHVAGAMCAECYRELAAKANELAATIEHLRFELDTMNRQHRVMAETLARLGNAPKSSLQASEPANLQTYKPFSQTGT